MRPHVIAVWEVDSFDYRARMKANYKPYTVALRDSGVMHCTCEAFHWGQGEYCKHIQLVLDSEPAPIESNPLYFTVPVVHDAGKVMNSKPEYVLAADVVMLDNGAWHISNPGQPDVTVGIDPRPDGVHIKVYQYK